MLALPEGYRGGRLKRSEIPSLIANISAWHPDISVGAASCYMREDFYTEKAFLDGETEKDLLVILIKRGDELAGIGSWEREQDALAIYAGLGPLPRSIEVRNWQSARWSLERAWHERWERVSFTVSRH
jgi:hypothetical protein